MSVNRLIVYSDSKMMYHFILFVSFILAVISIPYVGDLLTAYLEQEWLRVGLSYLGAYLLAVYALPELGFLVYKSFMKKE